MLAACGGRNAGNESKVSIIEGGLKLCESVYVYDGNLIIPNFGCEELNPTNTEGKGYVSIYTDEGIAVMIPNDGKLSAPKGTIVKDQRLFIADVGKLVIYNLNAPHAEAQVILFPENEPFVNDMAVHGNKMFITVTNTGNIYTLDTTPSVMVNPETLSLYSNVPGVNGIFIDGNSMYLASSDSENPADNVIYLIEDIGAPETIVKLTEIPGVYDGLAINDKGNRLYYTNWQGGEVGYYDLKSGEMNTLDLGVEFAGPARLAFDDGKLYIPDMPNSRVIAYQAE